MLNSNLEKGDEEGPRGGGENGGLVPQPNWRRAKQAGVKHIIVFQHIPFFLKDPNEADLYFNIPPVLRTVSRG